MNYLDIDSMSVLAYNHIMIDFCFASNAKELSKFGGCVFYLAYNHIMVDFCFALSENEVSGFGQYVYLGI